MLDRPSIAKTPIRKRTNYGGSVIKKDAVLVVAGLSFHAGILLGLGASGQVARKKTNTDTFPYKITLLPRGFQKQEKRRVVGANQWRHRAIHSIRMKFWYQEQKARRRAQSAWYKFYSVTRYGAPGRLEFICPFTGMVAKTIQQEEAISHRKYWIDCASTSADILKWLDEVDPNRYTSGVHSYLLSLLVVRPPILREVAAYENLHPFTPKKPWQTTRGTSIVYS